MECNDGFTLTGNACVQNECTCEDGTAATGAACTSDSAEICACSNNDDCPADQVCDSGACASACIKSADVNGDGQLNGQDVTDLESGYYYGCIIRGTRAASAQDVSDLPACADEQCTAAHFDIVTPNNFKCTSCN